MASQKGPKAAPGPGQHPAERGVWGTGVVCVLGCRSGSAAIARRAQAACDAFVEHRSGLVLACGGMAWGARGGDVEADELARLLRNGGVPADAIVCERASRDTYENATHAARILVDRGLRDVVLVTCSWHLPRARMLFERAGLHVTASVGVPPPNPGLLARTWWPIRERVAIARDRLRG